ncbi:MAG: thioredoxin [Flavobacteriales bacterium]|nr:MAG: thioredoxin [Flavobacteriales bacterium]
MSWEEAVKAGEKETKLVFVDIYTSWCGWCKVMDNKTFSNNEIAKMLNESFYPVKLNAEMADTVQFNNYTFVNPNPQMRRSTHQLAASLLDNQLSYPSFVMLNEKFQRLHILKGFKDAKYMNEYLQFYIDGKHLLPPPDASGQSEKGG